jgi:hypothetical protein
MATLWGRHTSTLSCDCKTRRPSGFIAPCLPSKVARPMRKTFALFTVGGAPATRNFAKAKLRPAWLAAGPQQKRTTLTSLAQRGRQMLNAVRCGRSHPLLGGSGLGRLRYTDYPRKCRLFGEDRKCSNLSLRELGLKSAPRLEPRSLSLALGIDLLYGDTHRQPNAVFFAAAVGLAAP